MDLWIRSQDKMNFVKVNQISLKFHLDKWHLITNLIKFENDTEMWTNLGTYETKERALEVLDYISTSIAKDQSLSDDYNEADIQVKCSIANSMIKVYQMPKE